MHTVPRFALESDISGPRKLVNVALLASSVVSYPYVCMHADIAVARAHAGMESKVAEELESSVETGSPTGTSILHIHQYYNYIKLVTTGLGSQTTFRLSAVGGRGSPL